MEVSLPIACYEVEGSLITLEAKLIWNVLHGNWEDSEVTAT